LQERFKESKILVLHIGSFPSKENIPTLNIKNIEPNEIQKFLELHIKESDISSVRIIEWRASLEHYREAYVKLISQVVDFIKRSDASKRTTDAFGKRWVKNFFKNLKILNKNVLFKQTDIPVIITGSGPSLEEALPIIKEAQKYCYVIASSSSLLALFNYGITPDITIATDGGSWALKHMYSFYRSKNSCALAVNLCAALPSQCYDTPILLINDGTFWQNIVLHELSLPSVIVPQRGTVTATAVDFAIHISRGSIYLAGMDLSVNDIKSHVRPYAFDQLLIEKSCRFSPVYSQSFLRSSLINSGQSLNIYASWFKTQLNSWPNNIFSIAGKHSIFKEGDLIKQIKNQTQTKKANEYLNTVNNKNDTSLFCKRGVDVLLKALKDPQYSENLKQELVPLVGQDIETSIKELAL